MKIAVFCGGAGTRMWPLSKKKNQKQFLPLIEDKSLFQLMVERLKRGFNTEDIYVVAGKEYRNQILDQAHGIPKENIIFEPEMRDTTAAVGFTTLFMQEKFPNEPIAAIWGADHIVKNEKNFIRALKLAEKLASRKNIIAKVDVRPVSANTNMGYVRIGEKIENDRGLHIYEFIKHVEKPNLKKAQEFQRSGDYLWNTGYLVWRPATFLGLLEKHSPDVFNKLEKVRENIHSSEKNLIEAYSKIPKVSIDYSLFEKLGKGEQEVIEVDLGWTDVGSLSTLKTELTGGKHVNLVDESHIGLDTEDSMIFCSNKNKVIATIGLKDMVVIDTKDSLLICPVSRTGDVKKIVEILKKRKKEEYL